MTANAVATSGHPVRVLSDVACRSLLAGATEGRLFHPTGRGPRAVVVLYDLTDAELVFRLPEYNEICQYAHRQQIAFEMRTDDQARSRDIPLDSGDRATVTVTGIGYRPEASAGFDQAAGRSEVWPPGVTAHVLCLDLTRVRGIVDRREP